ncbi:TPA: 50S ribosomal protein L40e [Candidatus Micrarchaeota archaeon]|nr:50S ribosomal protein L40e [Candidatus Micrarchaeota archaeon]
MGFPEAEARLFNGVWVCMSCNARNRSAKGRPEKCRRCGSKKLRPKAKEPRK